MFGPGSGAILLGDATTHGGRVISGQSNYLVNGKQVAVVGDKVTCPQDGHDVCSIIEGHPTISVNGKAVAFHGCATSCGARLISSCSNAHCIGSPDAPSASDMTPPVQLQQPSPAQSFAEPAPAEEPPVVNMEMDRLEIMLTDTPAIFEIVDNPNSQATSPLYEVETLSEVPGEEFMYYEVATEAGIDPNLLMAVAHMETSRGWYDGITGHIRPPKSFRPMNIYYDRWKPLIDELGYTRDNIINNRRANLRVGAEILHRIEERVVAPSVEKVASIYNFLGAEQVNDYGMRVKEFYDTRPWIR